jgi:hypothetical protein
LGHLEICWQAGLSAREFRTTHCVGIKIKNMEDYSIERSGIANLDFTGELIGQGGSPIPRIKIYRTKANKYVGEMSANQKMAQAQHFDNPVLLINWFKNLVGITGEIQDAIEDAAKNDEVFKAAWNEHVD